MAADSPAALVADIGGTHARFAIADPATRELSHVVALPSASFDSLQDALQAYLASIPARPGRACFALAAPLTGERVRMTNLPWTFTREELREASGVGQVRFINDFSALARAVPELRAEDLHQIGGGCADASASRLVLGPGTGLGLAGIAATPSGWVPLSSEGGHITLPVRDAEELAIRERIGDGKGHVSVEQLVSGPGLARLYTVLAGLHGRTAEPLSPAQIAALGLASKDPVAIEALTRFIDWLGRFAGDMALAFGARGGVYLGGGIAPAIVPALQDGRFRTAFDDKGRMTSYVEAIPVYVILARDAGLRGAAMALAEVADNRQSEAENPE